nr:unnamed protein product [Callosobruchus chinensis]
MVAKAGANEANHLRKRFLTLYHNLSLTLCCALDSKLDDSRPFRQNVKVIFREIQSNLRSINCYYYL